MKTDNVVQTKSDAFALRIIKVYKYLNEEKKEFILSKQLLRSGTSIGANIEEARESKYWIRLLRDSEFLTIEQSNDLLKDIDELLKIIGTIQKSIRNS